MKKHKFTKNQYIFQSAGVQTPLFKTWHVMSVMCEQQNSVLDQDFFIK